MNVHQLSLTPPPPFRLDLAVWVLRRIADNQVDLWDGKTYRRVLVVHGHPVEICVTQTGSTIAPLLEVSTTSLEPIDTNTIRTTIVMMFGLSLDLSGFYKLARNDKQLAELIAPFVGMRPTRFPTLFEALLNAVACQQVSLQAGLQTLNRLSRAFGQQHESLHALPTPRDLAGLAPVEIKQVGFSLRKAETIAAIARTIASGDLSFEHLDRLPDDQIISRLTSFSGIGRWSAEYVLLRGMGRLQLFPGDDVGGAAKLQKWLSLKNRPVYADIQQLLERWHPYEGLIYFHLLLRSLQDKGLIR